MEKITAILLLLPLITADIDTSTKTVSDFMAKYNITPEHDVTYSLVDAIKDMTITQFETSDNRKIPTKTTGSEKKDRSTKSTYKLDSGKISYELTVSWEFDAARMEGTNQLSDSYIGLTLKTVKLDGRWQHKKIGNVEACGGAINKEFNDIDTLLDVLLKFSINNTDKAEIRSDNLFQNIKPDTNCVNQSESKEEVSKNLETKSYLKIIAQALKEIPTLINRDANQKTFENTKDISACPIGENYAYFINDSHTLESNNELMIRGFHQLRKITIQYPDYGQVTSASEFKIPVWRAQVSWFHYNESEMPMHLDIDTEYLMLKGNISGGLDKLGIEFNRPETVTLNGSPKNITDDIRKYVNIVRNLTKNVMNQTSTRRASMLQYNINLPLFDTIRQIARQFNNNNFTTNAKDWNLHHHSRNEQTMSITTHVEPSKPNHTVCNFFENLRVNLFHYKKIIGNKNFSEITDQGKNETKKDEGKVQIIIREPNISVIRTVESSTSGRSPELLPNGKKKSVMFNFTTKYPNGKRRKDLAKKFTDELTSAITHLIGSVTNNKPAADMVEICGNPFKNTTKIYNWFLPDQHQREYYFAADDEYIDPRNFSSELKLIDIMMKNMTKFESVDVRYLSDVNNFNLTIRNVSGNMIQAGNGAEPTELNFTMDVFQLIMNYSASDNSNETVSDVKVRTNGFKVKSSVNESLIQEVFEKTTASFIMRVLNNQTKRELPSPDPSSTPLKNEPFDVNGIEYLKKEYDIAKDTADSIANILRDFHNNTENQTSESKTTTIDSVNDPSNSNLFNLTDISMNYTILGIQDEMCDFEKTFRANYEDIHVVLKGNIIETDISTKQFPFSLLISSLNISKGKGDSGFQTEMSFEDKRIFINTSNTDIESSDRKTMKNIIRDHVQPKIQSKINQTWRFEKLYKTCMKPVQKISENETNAEKYFYLISNPNHNQPFHLPLRINYIAIWGFSNYNTIKTTKVRNGTSFHFVVENLVARVNWCYQYGENLWSKSMQMDLHAGFLSLAGNIDKNTTTLKWEESESRLMFNVFLLPPLKKKTITVEKMMHQINETMLSHIKDSIENSFNASKSKPSGPKRST